MPSYWRAASAQPKRAASLRPARSLSRALGGLALISIMLRPGAAIGFDSDEHKMMGDLALAVADAYVAANHVQFGDDDARTKAIKAIKALRDTDVSYGEVVQCVDYFLSPEKLLAYPWKESPSSASPGGLPEIETKYRFPDGLAKACDSSGVVFAQATHINHAHFQQDLLMSLRVYHLMAIGVAKEKDQNFYGALFVNAIADHYLHDLFAPGHILTPRDALPDVVATAMHDLANREGVNFAPNPIDDSLRPILRFICGDDEQPDLGAVTCKAGNGAEKLSKAGSLEDITAAVRFLGTGRPGPIAFRGDSHLWDATREQAIQRTLLLAVEVRSILDVLEGRNSLTHFQWEFDRASGSVFASFDYGQYRTEPRLVAAQEQVAPATTEAASASDAKGGKDEHDRVGESVAAKYRLGTFSTVVGVSLHREAMSSGPRTGRNVLTAEAAPAGFSLSIPWSYLPNVVVAPVIGYSGYREGSARGSGPTLRVVFAIPETEFSLGGYARWLSYPTIDGDVRKPSFGLRVDSGFSSYFTFFLGAGQDYGTKDDGTLQRGWLWLAGVEVAFPLTRLPGNR